MATVRVDAPPPDPGLQDRLAAFTADLDWLRHRQAERTPLTEAEYDRRAALQRESMALGGAHAVAWWKVALAVGGHLSTEVDESRRSIAWARAAEARRH